MNADVTAILLIKRDPYNGPVEAEKIEELLELPATKVRQANRPGHWGVWSHELPTVTIPHPEKRLEQLLDQLEGRSEALAQLRTDAYSTTIQVRVEHPQRESDRELLERVGMSLLAGTYLTPELLTKIVHLGLDLWLDPELKRNDDDDELDLDEIEAHLTGQQARQ